MAFTGTIKKMSMGEPTSRVMRAMSLLVNNPRMFFIKLGTKIGSIRPLPKSPVRKKINGVLFEFELDYDRWIKEMYLDNYEIETVEVMKRVLKPGDTFIDVGANVGYLTAIGAGLVGAGGEIHSFEPVSRYFQRLKNIIMLNPDYRIILSQCALGEEKGSAEICIADPDKSDIGWDTMVSGHLSCDIQKEKVEVPVHRLDEYIFSKDLGKIKLIKIDTEGFEFPILKGLENYFKYTENLPVILCEIIPSAYPSLGYSLNELRDYMRRYDYHAFSLFDTNVELDVTKFTNITSVVFQTV